MPFRLGASIPLLTLETIRYLELNADSLPYYGKRYVSATRTTGLTKSVWCGFAGWAALRTEVENVTAKIGHSGPRERGAVAVKK